MNIISLKNVIKEYKGSTYTVRALDGINLEIEQGEMIAIVGESGSGKTTLLNMIGGLDSVTSGQVIVNGTDISSIKRSALDKFRKDTIGFCFQNFELMDKYTVYENVEMPLLVRKLGSRKRNSLIKKELENLGIWELKSKYPNELSGGQQQRVALARALCINNPILLADEPTGALDSENAGRILQIFKDIQQRGITVIIVTHSEMVANACDRIVRITDGRLQ